MSGINIRHRRWYLLKVAWSLYETKGNGNKCLNLVCRIMYIMKPNGFPQLGDKAKQLVKVSKRLKFACIRSEGKYHPINARFRVFRTNRRQLDIVGLEA